MNDSIERRRSQRVDARLRLKMDLDEGQAASLETINISTSGVYFRSDHYLAPMTKLQLGIEVSVPGPTAGETDLALVSCEGLVVRVQPEAPDAKTDEYEVAVFFTSVDTEGQQILADHIELLMTDA